MQNDKKNKSAQITDEALDEMLAQWAEAEIEPVSYTHLDVYKRQGYIIVKNGKMSH